jgi:predicted dehydrogenase
VKQVLQSLRTGATEVADVPCPAAGPRHLLVRTSTTLVSAGTERMLVEFGKAGWLAKARQQPDKVRLALEKIKTDGLAPTLEAIFRKLDQPLPLGYCNVGRVLEAGSQVHGFAVGDRVVSNGRHAEVVAVPANLCAKVPAGVSDEAAAFTVLGAIALQGIRLAAPTLGETVVVMGLGLVGLLTVQLLLANGCRVIGIDVDAARLELARSFGAEVIPLAAGADPVAAAERLTGGRGVDAVLIAASTSSSDPVHQAARMSRKRGRIVLVGVTGLELSRADFYEKELSFQVSCSYGPGRHDPTYEEQGVDYPIGFVRWTEQRNFEAVLDMLAAGRLDVRPLISHRFAIDRAAEAYDLITGGGPSLGVLLDYPPPAAQADATILRRTVPVTAAPARAADHAGPARVAFVGAGNYATSILMPAFRAAAADLRVVATQNGASALHAARRHGIARATTDLAEVFDAPDVDAVVIATRHDSHAALACRALRAGKHVYVEKPLALTHDDVDAILAAWETRPPADRPLLTVGFNRRFAPHVVRMQGLLAAETGPKAIVITVNAGVLPSGHWTQDADVGGGRIVGEGCHFVDLARHLAGSPITRRSAEFLDTKSRDSATLSLAFADGSIAAIHYLANGHRAFPKERVEVFAGGRILALDNFRSLTGHGWPGFSRLRLWRQDKGQAACAAAFVKAVAAGGPAPIPMAELVEVAHATIDLAAGDRT